MKPNRSAATAALTFIWSAGVFALPNGGHTASNLVPRAECKPYRIDSGDTCFDIAAERCGNIKLDDLYRYNDGLKDKCSSLKVGTYVCCSEGTMPDMDPPGNADGTCKYIQVDQNDGCFNIAKDRCGIEPEQLYKFNGGSDSFCNTLVEKQPLCCTKGTLPDLKPKKNADGSCATHSVADNEVCGSIAGANFLTPEDIEKFNVGKTWGFAGCDRLQRNQIICISDGTPPFPAEIPDVQCGPQKPGTKPPTDGKKLADLNPCPLNACCSVFGYCGTTPEFCVDTTVDKTPGTAKNGTNGCISNCGLDIVNNKDPPNAFSRIAYFESWNPYTRACLNMDVTDVPKTNGGYTHIHFAFGNITEDFQISVSGVQEQWDKFLKLKDIKRVIAFGGWAFSNEGSTNHIIRNGVKPTNREKFASNVVDFVNKNNLDGVDFDWEYPGATDIEGADPGTPEDGTNYLKFLKIVKDSLGSGKTVSFAAPASFWYLKNFPIKQMAQIVDYIVYMTYDLHGQWDVDNEYSMEGCKGGNCLRSHVNKTETMYSLAMVTKAGVQANKVFVGVSSYGRSFKMAETGCHGPDCTFLGEKNKSPAKEGECTETSGYIADAEIRQIQKIADLGYSDATYQSLYDEDSDSDIFIYDNNEWVAWMDTETKARRTDLYKGLNFAGTSDWAVDLQADFGSSGSDDDDDDGNLDGLDLSVNCNLDKAYGSLDDLDKDADDMWPPCLAMQTVQVLQNMLSKSLDGYDEAAEGYDGLFPTYEKWIKDTLDQRLVIWLFDDEDDKKPGHTYYKCFAAPGTTFTKREDAKEVPCDKLPGDNGDDYSYWFEMKDKKGYEKSLSEAGIDVEWVEARDFEKTDGIDNCPIPEATCITTNLKFYDYPRGKDKIDVLNPIDVVDAARENFTNINQEYDIMFADIGMNLFDGSIQDAVDVLSVPVFLLRDAVDAMSEVKELAKKIKEEEKKDLILKIVEGILFLIPFVGGAVGGLGRAGAQVARFLTAIDTAGSAGLGIYSMIDDPDTAPVAVLGMVMGMLGTPSGSLYRKLGNTKRDMTAKMKDKMGKSFKEFNPKVESISSKMCKGSK